MASGVNGGEGASNATRDDLPLRMLSDSMITGIRELLSSEGALLAVLPPHQAKAQYGATVRVERFSVEDHSAAMTGAARQRFRLIQRLRPEPSAQILWGEVEILPQDRAQSIPFDYLCWHQENIQNMLLSNIHGEWFRKPQTERSSRQGDDEDEDEKSSLVHYLALPSDRQDPNLFAYWWLIELLEQVEEDIFCSMCGSFREYSRDFQHDSTWCSWRHVDRAHVFVDMMRSTEDTWFAGYAWSITHCNSCYLHLGWRFDRWTRSDYLLLSLAFDEQH
ncbi:hypothetical protein GQ600_6538 [Phytophthora cactorum]|nr:hypothetical protein GQ600_6538 [Phytophthora cactorum]